MSGGSVRSGGPSSATSELVLDAAALDGAVFDMDGVVTSTARLHEAAWAETLNAALRDLHDPIPFSHEDYLRTVDGRERVEGARAFLASRSVAVEADVLERVAAAKNAAFLRHLDREGARPLEGVLSLLAALREFRLRCGLFTASRNASRVLAVAGLADAFDACVDGVVAASEGLAGKPAPDVPLACASRLGVAPSRCALFEDAEAGVRAGLSGGFACVVGVARGGGATRLREIGAHAVVASLADVALEGAADPVVRRAR